MKNPLIPFALTAAIGIILMLGMALYGVNSSQKLAAEGEEQGNEPTQEVAEGPEGIYQQSCVSCHGQNLEGGVGPQLSDVGSRLSAEEIQNVIINGQGTMPGGMVDQASAEQLASWLAEKK